MDEEHWDGDERGGIADADKSVRRSSYRASESPWSQASSNTADEPDPQLHSDDELADILAEEVARFTASMPVITPEMLREYSYPGAELMGDESFGGASDVVPALPPLVWDSPADPAPAPEIDASSVYEAYRVYEAPPTSADSPERDESFVSESPILLEAPVFYESAPVFEASPVFESAPVDDSVPAFGDTPVSASPVAGCAPARDDSFHYDVSAVSEPSRAPEFPAASVAEFSAQTVDFEAPTPSEPVGERILPPLVEPQSPPPGELSAAAGLNALLLMAPPPAPGTIVKPPPGSALPDLPRRRSLDDDDLLTVVRKEAQRTGSTRGAIDELEAQLQIRGEEAREFFTWEQSMLAIGTPEALDAIERARPAFTGVIPIVGSMPPRSMEPIAPEPTWSPAPMAAPATTDAGPGLDDDDDIDESDRAWLTVPPGSTITVDPASDYSSPPSAAAPLLIPAEHPAPEVFAEPVPTPIDHGVDVLGDGSGAPSQRIFSVEENDGEPTVLEYRAGRAARLFWLWFAANSSVVSVAFGAAVFSLGMSLRQALVATLAGVALSFIPLGLASLAGKWSGQPTMIVSRAAFGVVGNIVPAFIALLTRVFWGAAMLWAFAAGSSSILEHSGVAGAWGEFRFTLVTLAVAFLLSLVIAFFGFALISRVYLVFSILSGVLIVGLIALTWPAIDMQQALSTTDGPWMLVITGAVLVFSFIGLAWANSGADVSRYQRPGGSGAASMAWATVGTTLPSFVLIAYGSLLAASSPELASGLAERPLETLADLLPGWYAIPLLVSVGLSLVCGAVLTIYSGAFALQSAGVRLRRPAAVIVVGVLIGVASLALTFVIDDFFVLFRDIATTLAVPVAAWTGIFATDMMIRNRRFDGGSLMRRGGIYGDVNWVNLAMLFVATAVGFGLTTAVASGLEWQGYLFPLLGIPLDGVVPASDFGVIVALVLGLVTPIVSGVPRIRRQEQERGLSGARR